MTRGRQLSTVAIVLPWTVAAVVVVAAENPVEEPRGDRLTVRSTVIQSRSGDDLRRPAARRPPSPAAVQSLGDANAWFVVESADADFGEMLPEQRRELPNAFVLRIHSDRDWELRLLPSGDLEITGTADRVPLERLAWRAPESRAYEAFASPAPVTVARGGPTDGAGVLVSVDLRLELQDNDPLGRYAVGFRAMLEAR